MLVVVSLDLVEETVITVLCIWFIVIGGLEGQPMWRNFQVVFMMILQFLMAIVHVYTRYKSFSMAAEANKKYVLFCSVDK